jgi:beta-N-acetylhexosaminidase
MRSPLPVWALALALLAGCGEADSRPASTLPVPPAGVPEGGSNLGSDVRAQESAAPETTLLGALSSVLERGAPGRTDPAGSAEGPVRSARDLADRLPRSRAAAQLLLAGIAGTDATRAGKLDLGGVLLERRNYRDVAQLTALTAGLVAAAEARDHTPPLIAVRQDGTRDTALPGLAGAELGRVRGASRVRRAARAAAVQLRALGIAMTLAPVADLDAAGTFGDEPTRVTELTGAAVGGFAEGGVTAAPLHFPGQGGATQDPLRGPAMVGGDVARGVAPFRTPLRALVVSNAAYASWDSVTPATLAPEAHALLREELRFGGVAIADNVLGAAAATGTSAGTAAVQALAAGCDMVLVRDAAERDEAHAAILAALRRGELPDARFREAVARVLELKAQARAFTP